MAMVAAHPAMQRGNARQRASANVSVPMVRLERVEKRFGDNVVLNGIDLSVAAGEVLVVIGRSGSGKSTLLRCTNLLEPLDGGSVFLEGE